MRTDERTGSSTNVEDSLDHVSMDGESRSVGTRVYFDVVLEGCSIEGTVQNKCQHVITGRRRLTPVSSCY